MTHNSQGVVWQLLDSRGIGGIETHVFQLAKSLNDLGIATTVIFLGDYGPHPLKEKLQAESIHSITLDGRFGAFFRLVRKNRPLLMHSHGYKANILCRLFGKLQGVATVSTFHAGEPGEGWVRVYNFLNNLTAPLSHNIAVSQKIADHLFQQVPVIPNFVLLPTLAANFNNAGGVAFVGRLSAEKGPDLFCQVAEQIADGVFYMFGDGPMRHQLEQQWGDRIIFHGMVSDMTPHWQKVGLLCISSRYEGLPLAALEAMAHGIPVAAFAVGALPTLVDDGKEGWIVPPSDVEKLATVIKDWLALNPEAKQAMAENAREKCRAGYSSQAVLPHILAVYDQALKKRRIPIQFCDKTDFAAGQLKSGQAKTGQAKTGIEL